MEKGVKVSPCRHSPRAWKPPCTARSSTPTSAATNMRPSSTCSLVLLDDRDAAAVMRACTVDLDELRAPRHRIPRHRARRPGRQGTSEAQPTTGFQRVIHRAVVHVQSSGREEVTGANVLVAIFAERESHAAFFLQEQEMTRFDAVQYISHGIAKRAGMSEPRHVRGVDEEQTASEDERDGRRSRRRMRSTPIASTSTRRPRTAASIR